MLRHSQTNLKDGNARPIMEQRTIELALTFYKQPIGGPIDENKIRRLHAAMDKQFSSYETFIEKSPRSVFVINKHMRNVLLATSRRVSFQRANVMPLLNLEKDLAVWMEKEEWKGFQDDPSDQTVYDDDMYVCPFDTSTNTRSVFSADKPVDPGNRIYSSIFVSDKKQIELNKQIRLTIQELTKDGKRENVVNAIQLTKRSRISECPKQNELIRNSEEQYQRGRMESIEDKWKAVELRVKSAKIKGIKSKTNGDDGTDEGLVFLSMEPASHSSFTRYNYVFIDQYSSVTKFKCVEETKKHRNVSGINRKDIELLFDAKSEKQFVKSVADQLAFNMVSVMLKQIQAGRKDSNLSKSKESLEKFADDFFGDKNRKKFFGSMGNLYLQCTKLAVVFGRKPDGSAHVMPFVVYYRYLDDILRKSIDFKEKKLRCLNGCDVKVCKKNLTLAELAHHYESSMVLCFVCTICKDQFAYSHNFDQHFTGSHVKKGEYESIKFEAKNKFCRFMHHGTNNNGGLPLLDITLHPLFINWDREVPIPYSYPLYTSQG